MARRRNKRRQTRRKRRGKRKGRVDESKVRRVKSMLQTLVREEVKRYARILRENEAAFEAALDDSSATFRVHFNSGDEIAAGLSTPDEVGDVLVNDGGPPDIKYVEIDSPNPDHDGVSMNGEDFLDMLEDLGL